MPYNFIYIKFTKRQNYSVISRIKKVVALDKGNDWKKV